MAEFWKRHRRILLSFAVFVCLLAVVLHRPILRAAGRFLVRSEPPVKSDAIILLGEEFSGSPRFRKALELYRAGWAPRIVAAGRFLRPYLSVAELAQRDLLEAGVPAADIILLAHSPLDRFEESAALSKLLRERGWRRVLIVSSLHDSRRIHYIFQRDLGKLAEVCVVAAKESGFQPENWWRSRRTARMVAQEYLSLLQVWFGRAPLTQESAL
jgi:uncharacterized SAM-binding protein YcdF (DUF218 family)